MPAASILIKPASANCNIDCKYCFYKCLSSSRGEYSKGFMREDTLKKLIVRAIDYAEGHLTFAFQGGEPTLAGLDFFRRAAALQQEYNTKKLIIENTIQTNGLLIDEDWARFLAEHHFLVGLSLDGPRKLHDRYRRDAKGKPTFAQAMRAKGLFDRYGVAYNILSVITDEAAGKASYLYSFYKRNGFPYVQLIPCMDERARADGGQRGGYAVNPVRYGRFLCEMFDLWYEDFRSGAQMDIRMFSNLAQMAAGYPPEECGMAGCCTCYFVVEGDGSVYPCDFYCLDDWRLGTLAQPFKELLASERAREFVSGSRQTAEKCRTCPHFSLCRGGCRRWRETPEGLNELCPAYELFFAHCTERIKKLGQLILQTYGVYGADQR